MTTFRDPRELLAEVRAERTIPRRDKLTDDDIDQLLERGEGGDPFTEDALALRFSEKHKDDLRYIALKGQWLKWDGDRWLPEATLLAFDLARDSCREDAAYYGNGKPPPGISSAKTVAAVERLAKADRRQAATLEQWDADDWVTNTEMATVDLRTGIGRPPNPGDYITKKTACQTKSHILSQ